MSHRRLVVAGLLAVALAGVAAGVLVARGSADTAKAPAGVLATGQFVPVSWQTRGQVTIARKADGSAVLRFRDFQTQNAPELWVVFEPAGGPTARDQLTHLRRAWGNQDYDVTAEVSSSLPEKVLVYCTKCGKVWGYATMRPTKLGSQV
jgi:hypothetical protein